MDIKWIDVEERMPSIEEDGEEIFVVLDNGMIFQEVWYEITGCKRNIDGRWVYGTTPIKYWATIKEQFENLPKVNYAAWRKKETCDESKRESA